jgi:hypothetical protein
LQRGPQGALKLKTELVYSSSSESSEASEEKKEEPFPVEPPSDLACPEPAPPAAENLISPEIVNLTSPEEDNRTHSSNPDSTSPPLSSGNKVVRTNWANFPLNTSAQSVLLTKRQVASGAISVPLGRAHSVLGAFSKSCTVTLQRNASSSTSSPESWPNCCYKLYDSQPTQVFLTKLKPFFQATSAKAGDVLTLSGVSPGICNAEIWHANSPQAVEFKSMLAHGWSDVSPPLKNPISPLDEATPDTAEKKKREKKNARQQNGNNGNQDGDAEVINLVNDDEEEDEGPPAHRTRRAPRRNIIYSSSESQEEKEDIEEDYDEEYQVVNGRKRRPGRPRKTPAGKQQQQQQQQQQRQQPGVRDGENATKNQNASLYAKLALERQTPITNFTLANPPPLFQSPAPPPSSQRRSGRSRQNLRRSPAKKPRKAYQTTPIDLTTVEGPGALVMGPTDTAAAAAGLNDTAATTTGKRARRQRNKRRAASRSPSPEPSTKRAYKTADTPGSSGGRSGYGSGGREKPGGGYSFRSEAAYIRMRRAYRKGTPQRAPEGEPNMQAYYAALAFVDANSRFVTSCAAA